MTRSPHPLECDRNSEHPTLAIERDERIDRDYIPLAGGYEFQTKGKGSTVRLLCPDGGRHPLQWEPPHVQKALEDCIRTQNAALTKAIKALIDIADAKLETGTETLGITMSKMAQETLDAIKAL